MDTLFAWCGENEILCTAIIGMLSVLVGTKKGRKLIADLSFKIKQFGFVLSQGIRKLVGPKIEEIFEEKILGALYRGMRSDNKKEPKDGPKTKS